MRKVSSIAVLSALLVLPIRGDAAAPRADVRQMEDVDLEALDRSIDPDMRKIKLVRPVIPRASRKARPSPPRKQQEMPPVELPDVPIREAGVRRPREEIPPEPVLLPETAAAIDGALSHANEEKPEPDCEIQYDARKVPSLHCLDGRRFSFTEGKPQIRTDGFSECSYRRGNETGAQAHDRLIRRDLFLMSRGKETECFYNIVQKSDPPPVPVVVLEAPKAVARPCPSGEVMIEGKCRPVEILEKIIRTPPPTPEELERERVWQEASITRDCPKPGQDITGIMNIAYEARRKGLKAPDMKAFLPPNQGTSCGVDEDTGKLYYGTVFRCADQKTCFVQGRPDAPADCTKYTRLSPRATRWTPEPQGCASSPGEMTLVQLSRDILVLVQDIRETPRFHGLAIAPNAKKGVSAFRLKLRRDRKAIALFERWLGSASANDPEVTPPAELRRVQDLVDKARKALRAWQ